MSKPLFLKLRNGAIICAADIQMILRKDINDYFLVLRGQDLQPRADGNDVDYILDAMVDVVEVPAPPKVEVQTRLAVPE